MSEPKGKRYKGNTLIQIGTTFYNTQLNIPADPFTAAAYVMDPLGNVTQIPSNQIVRSGIGVYSSNFMPTSPGQWFYNWIGSGPTSVQATTGDVPFFVEASQLIPVPA